MKYNIEVTDTFGGEANYSWVQRYTLDLLDTVSNYALVRRAKREIGWSGKRCLSVNYGNMIEVRPYGECMVAFVTWGN